MNSRRWLLSLGLCLLLALAAGRVSAAPLPVEWRHVQPVTLSSTGLVRFAVPLATLEVARAGREDLRILDAQGRELPILLDDPARDGRLAVAPAAFTNLPVVGSTVLQIKTGTTEPLAGVTLLTASVGFSLPARVEGSSDGRTWATLVEGQPVFALTNGAARLRVDFPAGTWPHLRVTVAALRLPAIVCTGIVLHPAVAEAEASVPLGCEVVKREESAGETHLTLRLEGSNVTLAGLTLRVADALFVRRVTLAQPGANGARWETNAIGAIYRLALEGRPTVSNLSVAADAPVRSRDLRLIIHHDGQAPLNVLKVETTRRPVFVSLSNPGGGPLQLLSGNDRCPAPTSDLAALRRDAARLSIIAAQAGPLAANPAYIPPVPVPPTAGTPAPSAALPDGLKGKGRLVIGLLVLAAVLVFLFARKSSPPATPE